MGTSASIGTPTNGNWSNAKREIKRVATNGVNDSSVERIIRETVRGITGQRRGAERGVGTGVGNGTFISDGAKISAARSIGFMQFARDSNFQTALQGIGISEFTGYDSTELISILVNAIIEGAFLLDKEIISNSLIEIFQDILGDDVNEFDKKLEEYWTTHGTNEFIKAFLKYYCERLVLHKLTDAVLERISKSGDTNALTNSIALSVDVKVDSAVDDITSKRTFDEVDWFGNEGRNIMDDIANNIAETIEAMI